jgi:protein-glutamine gamma-glutamyltransferase
MRDVSAQRLSPSDSAWIALALVMAALPHATRNPWWVSALAAGFAAWHLYIVRMRLTFPGRWATAAMAVGCAAVVYLEFRTLFGRDPGIALLIAMLSLKLLEMKNARDAALLLALGFFLVLTNFLFSQTLLTAAYLLVCVWLITAAMARLQQRQTAVSQKLALRTAGILLAQSVPLMLVLFLLFPRVQGPLWGMPKDAHTGLSGLSDTMTPGSMTHLILSDDIAFRARFTAATPPPEKLYWRGPVLSSFDGRTWTAAWARASRIRISRPTASRSNTRSRSRRTTCGGCSLSICRRVCLPARRRPPTSSSSRARRSRPGCATTWCPTSITARARTMPRTCCAAR